MADKPDGQTKRPEGLDKAKLVKVVDSVPATKGLDVALRRHGRIETLRASAGTGGTVLFELRERYVDSAYFKQVSRSRAPFKTAGTRQAGWSVMKGGTPSQSWPAPVQRAPISRLPNRTSTTIPPKEWASLGLNCAGMAIAWVGVVGAGLLAPVTGGISAGAAVVMYGGAIAGTGQCLASVYRVNNARRGRSDINDKLDASPVYKWTMLGADAIGLWGAKGGLTAARKTAGALKSTGVKLGDVNARAFTAATRGELTMKLGLDATRVGSRVISRVVKVRLLEGAGAVLGIAGSIQGGIVQELVVWVMIDLT